MSLILDALRKSEAERRRGQLPALTFELPPAHARRQPSRAWWLLLPIAAAFAAAAYFATRSQDVPPSQAAPAAEGPEQFVLPERGPEPGPTTVPADLPPAPADVVIAPPVAAPSATPAPPPAPAAPQPAPPQPAAPVAATASASPVLALSDLTASERQALPPLKLSMHMWSEDPARRFAIIDGQRVAEGARIGNAVVERIEPAGVVLAADGRRIRLPLP